jgi:hypothetical protein
MGETGGVVTSAGLVFAFTMAAMLGSDLTVLGQFGSTVCIGLLLSALTRNSAAAVVGTPIAVGSKPVAIAITPDGSLAYVADYGSNQIVPVALSTGRPEPPITLSVHPNSIAITPDGTTAYVIADNGQVWPIALATDHIGSPARVPANSGALAILPTGGTGYFTNVADGTLTPFTLGTSTVGRPINLSSATPDAVGPEQASHGVPRQRLEYCGALRAFFRPYFFRSLTRGSRVRNPAFLSAGRSSASISMSARAIARRSAPACPVTPPPLRMPTTSYCSAFSRVTRGSRMSCWCTLFGK